MPANQKILLVDDDQDLLDLYQQILARMPSRPEILTARNAARAGAMLESEPFALLICDLRMPKMDGLQLLAIVRRKYPQIRTVVLTSVLDEEFRSRAYAIGVDLFWIKPGTDAEVQSFIDCLESLLTREAQAGFRGLQNKSLMDLLQLECLSQNSLVLRITNGPLTGNIWIQSGDIIDAAADELTGEPAFKAILTWKNGTFESLPAESDRPRAIQKNYNALLLETMQAIDESRASSPPAANGAARPPAAGEPALTWLSRLDGAEFALIADADPQGRAETHGLENSAAAIRWARQTRQRFERIAERLHAGPLQQIECLGPQRSVSLAPHAAAILCLGWRPDLSAAEIHDRTRKAFTLWAS